MNSNILGEKDGFLIRLAKAEDAAGYFEQNFCPLDQEVVRLTGCKEEFTKDEVVSFFMKSLKDDERYFFLIIAPDGSIIGESIINEIDCGTHTIFVLEAEEAKIISDKPVLTYDYYHNVIKGKTPPKASSFSN